MGQRRKTGVTRESAVEQNMRDQEVLRANRELAAYFKGQRTEREARAALKIIKAFVRDRERRDASSRPPLPGVDVAKTPKEAARSKIVSDVGERHRRKLRRKRQDKLSRSVTASVEPEPQLTPEPPLLSEADERTSQ
jgi:hypothetical protein